MFFISPAMTPNNPTSTFITITKAFVTVICSLCSILGAVRTGFYMMNVINTKGFRGSVCDNSLYSAPVSKFWAYAFVLSKAPELGKSSSAVNHHPRSYKNLINVSVTIVAVQKKQWHLHGFMTLFNLELIRASHSNHLINNVVDC